MTGTQRNRPPLSIAVVVPSYQRPERLRLCLAGVRDQRRPADQVVVAARENDHATRAVIREHSDWVEEVTVNRPGQVEASRAAVGRVTCDLVAFTDDDAVPAADWLERLMAHFADPEVVAVGGRDVLRGNNDGPRQRIGEVTAWGRLLGWHHCGTGGPRDVHALKGVNMAFRREAIAVAEGLRGQGAEVHNDLAMSLWAGNMGRLVYDPGILVDHDHGPRFDADQRHGRREQAVSDEGFNLVAVLLHHRPGLFWRRALYGIVLGDRATPGIGRAVLGVLKGQHEVVRSTPASLLGQLDALRQRRRGIRMVSLSAVPVGADAGGSDRRAAAKEQPAEAQGLPVDEGQRKADQSSQAAKG